MAPYIKYYREQLGEELVAPLVEIGSFDASVGNKLSKRVKILISIYFYNFIQEPVHDTFLATFPLVLNHPDILDLAKVKVNNSFFNLLRLIFPLIKKKEYIHIS